MAGLADFHADAGRQFGGQAQPGAENFQDERIAGADEFHAATHANTQRFQTVGVLVVGLDAAHDGAEARRQFIEPHRGDRLSNSCHNDDKISFPASKSNSPRTAVDTSVVNKHGNFPG